MDSDNMTLRLVDDLSLSKYYVARRCGVSWYTVQRWYQGKFKPLQEHQQRLEEIYEEFQENKVT